MQYWVGVIWFSVHESDLKATDKNKQQPFIIGRKQNQIINCLSLYINKAWLTYCQCRSLDKPRGSLWLASCKNHCHLWVDHWVAAGKPQSWTCQTSQRPMFSCVVCVYSSCPKWSKRSHHQLISCSVRLQAGVSLPGWQAEWSFALSCFPETAAPPLLDQGFS